MEDAKLVEFVRQDYPRVVAALAHVCGDPGRAEDAVQDALAAACEHGSEILDLRAWVARTALNKARSRSRSLGAERRAHERAGALRHPPSAADGSAVDDAVADELRRLPMRQREIVVLHYLLDLPVADVADVLGVATGTVKTQLFRARATLRDRLRVEFDWDEEAGHVGG